MYLICYNLATALLRSFIFRFLLILHPPQNSVTIYSPSGQWKVRWGFLVNKTFLKLPRIMPDYLLAGAIYLFLKKLAFNFFSCFGEMLPHCFVVKLQKYFVDKETSPILPSPWGWLNNWLNFHFWVSCSKLFIILGHQSNISIPGRTG